LTLAWKRRAEDVQRLCEPGAPQLPSPVWCQLIYNFAPSGLETVVAEPTHLKVAAFVEAAIAGSKMKEAYEEDSLNTAVQHRDTPSSSVAQFTCFAGFSFFVKKHMHVLRHHYT
jgi:hypothetical protein